MSAGAPLTTEAQQLRRWSEWLDAAFRIPGTRLRVGWDPILGLLPGVGDIATQVFSVALVLQAFRLKLPKVVQLRILFNLLLDMLAGAIPVAGDLFDVAWKANIRNVRLIERHATVHPARRVRASPADWLFVIVALMVVAVCALVPMVALVWLIQRFGLV